MQKLKAHDLSMSIPTGVLAATFPVDLAYLATGDARLISISFWMIAVGIIGFLAAFASREVATQQVRSEGPVQIPIRRV
jgi:uncharacterized membrane protein